MRKGLLGTLAALAASAGLAQAQAPGRLPVVPVAPNTPAIVAGRSTAGVADAIPIGPSTINQPPAQEVAPDGRFSEAMQMQPGMDIPPNGNGEPRLDVECAYGQLDYLLYFIRSQRSNYPLVTASTTRQLGSVGVGSTVLFGAQNLRFNPISGGQFDVTLWLPRYPRIGAEFVGEVLEVRRDQFIAGFGTQLVARPVIDATTGAPVSLLVAAPGYARGGVEVNATSQYWGFETNGKLKFWADATREVSGIFGFRYIDLFERLAIRQQTIFLPGQGAFFFGLPVVPQEIDVADSFNTRNQYLLAQIGLQGKCRYRRWSAMWAVKFAIGDDHQTSVVQGSSTLFLPPVPPATVALPNTVPGGLLALSSNIGRFHRDQFTVMPEGKVQVGYRLFPCTDVVLGYQFTYLSKAIRPGSQIDPVINPVFLPTSQFFGSSVGAGTVRPAPLMQQVDFWVQGVNFGLQIHY